LFDANLKAPLREDAQTKVFDNDVKERPMEAGDCLGAEIALGAKEQSGDTLKGGLSIILGVPRESTAEPCEVCTGFACG
jgi:hypothetical protein